MGGAVRKFTPNKSDLEAASLVWLDRRVNASRESTDAQQRLRLFIKNLTTFDNENDCEKYIKSLSENLRIILIVSGQCGKNIVPKIQQQQQIAAIYVYCGDKSKNEWTKTYPKVRGVATQLDELISLIRADREEQENDTTNQSLTFTTFNASASKEKLTVGLNGQFLHTQLLIDCLLQIEYTPIDMKELISQCKKEYENNSKQLQFIQNFEEKYSRDEVFRWYTKESFLYRRLNYALRTQDIHLIFLFRFLIADLKQQLKDHRCSSRVIVYRGQSMHNEELEYLRKSQGELISINSFLSTSLDRNMAFAFVPQSNNLERVLFQITADPRLEGTKPFADISGFSEHPEEKEVLFMLGSIFQLEDIHRDRNGIWTVKLTLCSNKDHGLNNIFNEMKREDKPDELGLIKLGNVLRRMGKYDEAEKYYHRCLDQLSSKDYHNISSCYYVLGCTADRKGDYDTALEWYQQSLDIDMKILNPNDTNIANTHNSIANVYQEKGDLNRALESYKKALIVFEQAFGEEDRHVAMCLNNIGAVYQKQKKYSEALNYYQKALNIRKKCLSEDHPDLGASYNNIGIVYRKLNQQDQALEHYNRAYRIYQRALASTDPDMAGTLENIAHIYEDKRDWKEALKYYNQAKDIYQQNSSTHSIVVEIDRNIERVSSQLK